MYMICREVLPSGPAHAPRRTAISIMLKADFIKVGQKAAVLIKDTVTSLRISTILLDSDAVKILIKAGLNEVPSMLYGAV